MRAIRNDRRHTLQLANLPMRRHIPQPLDAGGFHRGVGVKPLGDGVGDDGLPLFLEQGDERFLLGHQRVDLRRLAVEEGGDGGLFAVCWYWNPKIADRFYCKAGLRC